MNDQSGQANPPRISEEERARREADLDAVLMIVRAKGGVLLPAHEAINRRYLDGELTLDEHMAAVKAASEQAERRSVVEYLRAQHPTPNPSALEPRRREIEHRFIVGELSSQEAADELLKLVLATYPAFGSA